MDSADDCPCDSGQSYSNCCHPYVAGLVAPETALALMRSRYTAYVLANEAYLLATWHPSTRPNQLSLSSGQHWLGLKIKSTCRGGEDDETGEVVFVARYKIDGRGHRLEEHSQFVRQDGRWLYLIGH